MDLIRVDIWSSIKIKMSFCLVGFPSKVRDINFKEVRDSSVIIILSWKAPEDNGGLPADSLKYDIDCGDDCQLTFKPKKTNLSRTMVTISDYKHGHKYNFKIFSKNIISMLYAKGRFALANKTYTFPNGNCAVCEHFV